MYSPATPECAGLLATHWILLDLIRPHWNSLEFTLTVIDTRPGRSN